MHQNLIDKGVCAACVRLFTSAFFHAGLLHIGFNMLAFVPVATSLEHQLGSVQTLHLLLMLILVGDIFYISASYLASFVCAPDSQLPRPHLPKNV